MPDPENMTADSPANDQLLYFTSTSLLADDRSFVYISDRTGHENIFHRDIETGADTQLSDNTVGILKTYVYFDGIEHQGLGKASITLDPGAGVVYYLQGDEIRAAGLDGSMRTLNTVPADEYTAFTHVSDDGKLLCIPTVDARAFDVDDLLEGERFVTGFDSRMQRYGLSSYIRIYDTATGEQVACEEVERGWITHVSFCPSDSSRLLYNHEWPADNGVRRMWLWDGAAHEPLRRPTDGQSKQDFVCHEFWAHDGSAIVYHGRYPAGRSFVGRWDASSRNVSEALFPEGFDRYGHFTIGPHGRLITDGAYEPGEDTDISQEQQGDLATSGGWITLMDVDWDTGAIEWTPLCRSGSSWAGQDEHPHPIFNHDGCWVYFTSDRDGRRDVWRVAVPG